MRGYLHVAAAAIDLKVSIQILYTLLMHMLFGNLAKAWTA